MLRREKGSTPSPTAAASRPRAPLDLRQDGPRRGRLIVDKHFRPDGR
jgi:hypothetical protein